MTHVLTHQKLYVRFFVIHISGCPQIPFLPESLIRVEIDSLMNYPMPRLMHRFLDRWDPRKTTRLSSNPMNIQIFNVNFPFLALSSYIYLYSNIHSQKNRGDGKQSKQGDPDRTPGEDPEVTSFENGVKKATFTLATTRVTRTRKASGLIKRNGITLCFGGAWQRWPNLTSKRGTRSSLKAGSRPDHMMTRMATSGISQKYS
jgi:hypothetical protein